LRSADSELISLLRQTSLFESLEDAYLLELVASGRRKRYEGDQTVFMQGDKATGLYVVLKGRVKVFKISPKGRQQTLMLMDPGQPVGEVAVLSGEAYPATAETLEESELLYIPRQAFLDLVAREPEVALRLLAALSSRLRSFASLIEDLSLKDVSERLAAHLLALAVQDPAGQTIHLDVSKTQLASAVGTVPETLSRAFQQLSRLGAVKTTGRTVHIENRDLLEKVARARS
jgi:CRP/FNR family transcriptional regulator, dissimilatory nitrate respiration regulator